MTPDLGKIDVIGRGAQKGMAKLAPQLEPFRILSLEVIQGRRYMTVISAELKQRLSGLHRSFDARLLASSSCTFLDRAMRELGGRDAIYPELEQWLNFLDRAGKIERRERLLLYGGFLLRLISHLGYDIELEHCTSCRTSGKDPFWHPAYGGVVCQDCRDKDRHRWFTAERIDPAVLDLMQAARQLSYDDIFALSADRNTVKRYTKCIQDLVAMHVPGYFRAPYWEGVLI